nr:GntR family transcriptional regulator [uncultured bacterium]BAH90473.1 GntR family transcriptional regulator [uncultured bacterium]
MNEKKTSGSAATVIVRDVLQGLSDGRYVAGQRLAERDLAELYNLSRSSIREALSHMAADGIVEISPYKGARIRKLSRSEAANIMAISEVILGLAARQAAENIQDQDERDRLSASFQALENLRGADHQLEFNHRRNEYYRVLYELGKNDELRRMLPKINVHLVRGSQAVPYDLRIEGHREITEAVLAGDAEAAEAAARRYMRATIPYILQHYPN